VRERLVASGASDVAVEPYRGLRTYAWVQLAHVVAGLAGGPPALLALLAYELEVSGRLPTLRRLLAHHEGATVTARVPAAGARRATLVLVAHLDAQRTGLLWRVQDVATRGRRGTTIPPLAAPVGAAFALAALPGLRPFGRALLALTALSLADQGTSPTVPGANDNATGVAALVALAARLAADPVDGVEVLLVAPGGEEAGMDGFRAWLAAHPLDPATTFVLGLDTLGSGTPIVLRAEATLFPHAYAGADVALVEAGARRAGVPVPQRWRLGGWTDPVLARFAGLRATCLLSIDDRGRLGRYHVPQDTPEHVDLACVEACVRIAEGVARELA